MHCRKSFFKTSISAFSSLSQWLPRCSQKFLSSEHFLVAGKGNIGQWQVCEIWRKFLSSHIVLGEVAFWPPMTNVQVCFHAEGTSCFVFKWSSRIFWTLSADITSDISYICHFSQHRTLARRFHNFVKLTVANITDHHRHSHSHHTNVYDTHKHVFYSLLPYRMLFFKHL
jgi:hypothetical protein